MGVDDERTDDCVYCGKGSSSRCREPDARSMSHFGNNGEVRCSVYCTLVRRASMKASHNIRYTKMKPLSRKDFVELFKKVNGRYPTLSEFYDAMAKGVTDGK